MEAARQSRMIKNPYKSILKRKYRPQLVIASIFMIFQQFDVSPYTTALHQGQPLCWLLVDSASSSLTLCSSKVFSAR